MIVATGYFHAAEVAIGSLITAIYDYILLVPPLRHCDYQPRH